MTNGAQAASDHAAIWDGINLGRHIAVAKTEIFFL
jgi:hypothetical protein